MKKPSNGKVSLENIYVMRSRISNWEILAILRPFDDSIFEMRPDEKLKKFDEYLEEMDEATTMSCLSIEDVEKHIKIQENYI